MILDLSLMLVCLAFILGSCFLFSNAVEWLGRIYKLGHGVVGSIFAAIGTALPETIIPIIAILFYKGAHGSDIGIGAIAGAPFMLGTLAFFVTGAAIVIYTLAGKRTMTVNADPVVLSRDITYFVIIYSIAIATSFFHSGATFRVIFAACLVLTYGIYIRQVFLTDSMAMEEPDTFFLCKLLRIPVSTPTVYLQLLLSLAGIIVGAHFFIKYMELLSASWGVAPLLLSIIVTPIATELPEKLNSVIWTGQKKDTLALGNITGAMVFQSCFPVIIGMLFTPWKLDRITHISAFITIFMSLLYLSHIKLSGKLNPYVLMSGGIGYAVFLFFVLN